METPVGSDEEDATVSDFIEDESRGTPHDKIADYELYQLLKLPFQACQEEKHWY